MLNKYYSIAKQQILYLAKSCKQDYVRSIYNCAIDRETLLLLRNTRMLFIEYYYCKYYTVYSTRLL